MCKKLPQPQPASALHPGARALSQLEDGRRNGPPATAQASASGAGRLGPCQAPSPTLNLPWLPWRIWPHPLCEMPPHSLRTSPVRTCLVFPKNPPLLVHNFCHSPKSLIKSFIQLAHAFPLN